MNSEDNMIFNCGTFSTDGQQLVFENPRFESRLTDYAISVKESDLDKNEVAEK